MTTALPEPEALFESYLDVVRRALRANADRAPWNVLLDLARKTIGNRDICVAVYDDDPMRPVAWYAVRVVDEGLHRVDLGSVSPNDRSVWRVPLSHLEAVVDDPAPFIDNPARLDLDWLRRRVGLQETP